MKNNKGFVLTETLIVSAVVITVLIVIFANVRKITTTSNRAYRYNRANDVMLLESFGNYILNERILDSIDTPYIDLTSCDYYLLSNSNACSYLVSVSDIDTIILTKNNMAKLKEDLSSSSSIYPNDLSNYVLSINSEYNGGYRLIAKFNNDTYANLVILK